MIRLSLITIFSILCLSVAAQQIALSPQQIEEVFLKQNLELISRQMNISIADAAIAEAKVWDNPELSVSDINLWKRHEGGENGAMAIFPKQFSVELSQMISLSARRAKLVNVEKIGKDITIKQFEVLLRSLKIELRKSIAEVVYMQNMLVVIENQRKYLEETVAAYKTQYEKGNVTKNELLRLQTALFTLDGEINDTQTEFNALQKTLKNLLDVEHSTVIVITDSEIEYPLPQALNLEILFETALISRPDLSAAMLQNEYYRKNILYQRSLVMPDIRFGVKYDRYGGVWDNFFGAGVGVQIPIFNRNKGAIKTARTQLKQNEVLIRQEQKYIQNEIVESLHNYTTTYLFLDKSMKNPVLNEFDNMLEIYTKNLLAKNISMIEYMDFMDSFRSTKEILLRSEKELKLQFEQLQFSVGRDIK